MDQKQALEWHTLCIESWQFHVSYAAKMLVLYLAIIGALIKFMLDDAATAQLFYALVAFGICVTVLSCCAGCLHLKAVNRMGTDIAESRRQAGIETPNEQAEHYSSFVRQFLIFNTIVTIGFLTLLFVIDASAL